MTEKEKMIAQLDYYPWDEELVRDRKKAKRLCREYNLMDFEDEAGRIPFQPEPKELEPGPTAKRLGTGLGIPIAFKVCKAHGWVLKFRIKKGQGTIAEISIPSGIGDQDPAANNEIDT